jgi:hypothetical protein
VPVDCSDGPNNADTYVKDRARHASEAQSAEGKGWRAIKQKADLLASAKREKINNWNLAAKRHKKHKNS